LPVVDPAMFGTGTLVQLALREAFHHPGDLGEQVGPAAREVPQDGHRGGLLLAAQFTPPSMMPGLVPEPGDEDAVSCRALIGHAF